MADKYDILKLENQLCFPLYVASKEIIKSYKPFLDKLDLTYTQYIAMMVLWEEKSINVKELGKYLFLDSGTLTPLLKKLEQKKYITRQRLQEDERNVIVSVTEEGLKLRDEALDVPYNVGKCVNIDKEDAKELFILLHKVMGNFYKNE